MKLHRKAVPEFTGQEDHLIDLARGLDYIYNHRKYFGETRLSGGFFSKSAIAQLLSTPGSVGIRYYYAKIAEDTLALSMNSVAANRDDLIESPGSVILSAPHPVYFNGVIRPELSAHYHPLDEICRYTAKYRAESNRQPKGGYFSQKEIRNVFTQPGCIGIRFYFGSDSRKTRVMVLVGVDISGNDMFTGYIIEMSALCPPHCGFENHLNSNRYYAAQPEFRKLNIPADYINLAAR